MIDKIKKLFLVLLIIIFSSSCIVVYRDYPRRQNIRYHHIRIWGGWYDYYWSNLWYTYRYARYANRYSYRGKKVNHIVYKGSLQRPPSESSGGEGTVTKSQAKKKDSSSSKEKTVSSKGKVKKK